MDEILKGYADTLYERSLFESGRLVRERLGELAAEMSRTSNPALPMSGPELARIINVHVQHINRCMEGRFESFRRAYDEAGQSPSEEDFEQILAAVNDAQRLQIKHSSNSLNGFMRSKGLGDRDATGSLTSGSALGHDRVLEDWKVWRGQVQLTRTKPASTGEGSKAASSPVNVTAAARTRPDKSPMIYFLLGSFCSILPWGASLIGITVNLWLGAAVLLVSFGLIGYAFWLWETSSRWHVALRIGTVILAGLIYSWIVGKQIVTQHRKELIRATKQTSSPNPQASPSRGTESTPAPALNTPHSGSARTSGPRSPAVTGNGNSIEYSQPPAGGRKPKPK